MLTRIRDLFFRQDDRRSRCERAILPHLDAAYNLARWLTRNDQDAEEVWQIACLRAVQFFDGFQGTDARAWLLTIVRRSFYTWLQQQKRRQEIAAPFDDEIHAVESGGPDPEAELLRRADARLLHEAFEALPLPFREVIVLREIEGMSYKEIAAIVGIPLGTVMSRLARARRHLQEFLLERGVRRTS
ncbi:MAG TPA: sigma-70 family RNA polymerase sigma factor [Thermoanaerobaculia bacterium]|jgi:RNA polymerase sigma-70 factor (ECF subfamily)|nr:sigma-70 family RNA polymerase sigma factor [Thermoanaerobaculia bacterium]